MITLDPKMVELAWDLFEAESLQDGELVVKLGLLTWVLCLRKYKGHGKYISEVGLRALAERSRIGVPRLQRALDELVRQGVLVEVREATQGHMPQYSLPKEEVVVKSLEARQKELRATPSSVEGEPKLELKFWNRSGARILWAPVSVKDAAIQPICPRCGERYMMTVGQAQDGQDLCIGCWIADRFAEGQREFVIFGTKHVFNTKEEMLDVITRKPVDISGGPSSTLVEGENDRYFFGGLE